MQREETLIQVQKTLAPCILFYFMQALPSHGRVLWSVDALVAHQIIDKLQGFINERTREEEFVSFFAIL